MLIISNSFNGNDPFEFNFGSGLNQNIILNIENIAKFGSIK